MGAACICQGIWQNSDDLFDGWGKPCRLFRNFCCLLPVCVFSFFYYPRIAGALWPDEIGVLRRIASPVDCFGSSRISAESLTGLSLNGHRDCASDVDSSVGKSLRAPLLLICIGSCNIICWCLSRVGSCCLRAEWTECRHDFPHNQEPVTKPPDLSLFFNFASITMVKAVTRLEHSGLTRRRNVSSERSQGIRQLPR